MRKHEDLLVVLALVVLECTLSTYCEGTERTLPDLASRVQLEKQIPGLR
jgi:hypothetical protein